MAQARAQEKEHDEADEKAEKEEKESQAKTEKEEKEAVQKAEEAVQKAEEEAMENVEAKQPPTNGHSLPGMEGADRRGIHTADQFMMNARGEGSDAQMDNIQKQGAKNIQEGVDNVQHVLDM